MKIRVFNRITNETIKIFEGKLMVSSGTIKNENGEGFRGINQEKVGCEIIEQDESDFDFDKLTGRLLEVLSPESLFKLRHEIGILREFLVYWKNFKAVKVFLDQLLAENISTPEEYEAVLKCFQEQNISLKERG
jgi:hypothetical protein